jgi:hypothetical protein
LAFAPVATSCGILASPRLLRGDWLFIIHVCIFNTFTCSGNENFCACIYLVNANVNTRGREAAGGGGKAKKGLTFRKNADVFCRGRDLSAQLIVQGN